MAGSNRGVPAKWTCRSFQCNSNKSNKCMQTRTEIDHTPRMSSRLLWQTYDTFARHANKSSKSRHFQLKRKQKKTNLLLFGFKETTKKRTVAPWPSTIDWSVLFNAANVCMFPQTLRKMAINWHNAIVIETAVNLAVKSYELSKDLVVNDTAAENKRNNIKKTEIDAWNFPVNFSTSDFRFISMPHANEMSLWLLCRTWKFAIFDHDSVPKQTTRFHCSSTN